MLCFRGIAVSALLLAAGSASAQVVATAGDKCAQLRKDLAALESLRDRMGEELRVANLVGIANYPTRAEGALENIRSRYGEMNTRLANVKAGGDPGVELRDHYRVRWLLENFNLDQSDQRYFENAEFLLTAMRNALLAYVEEAKLKVERAPYIKELTDQALERSNRMKDELRECETGTQVAIQKPQSSPQSLPVTPSLPPPNRSATAITGNPDLWLGTWEGGNGRFRLTIGGGAASGYSLTYSFDYPETASRYRIKGSGSLTNCRIEASSGTCDWNESLETSAGYAGSSGGTATIRLSGDRELIIEAVNRQQSTGGRAASISMLADPPSSLSPFPLTRP